MAAKKEAAGTARLYETLCRVLDALRNEAPASLAIYHPPAGNGDALIQARSRALLHLFLKARFGLVTYAKREPQITDGTYDGGIDAYHIDTPNKCIYLLQSKFRATAKNFVSSNMGATDLLKMDVSRIMKGEKKSEVNEPYNAQILQMQKAISKLPDVGSYVHRVVLLGNSEHLTAGDLKKLVEGYEVEQLPHTKIFKELLFPVVNGTYFTNPDLSIEINLNNLKSKSSPLEYHVKTASLNANIMVVFVPTKEIGRIMSTYKNSILNFNPRSFLGLTKNSVNKEIEGSLASDKGNEFAMFNNGITLISNFTKFSSDTATQGKAQLVLNKPQLVNGGQTAYTLGRIYEKSVADGDFSRFKGKEVLLKIVTFVSAKSGIADLARTKLIQDISRASNAQTKIEEADRRSNDQIQLDLQGAFFGGYGLYYERKLGEFSDGINDGYIDEKDVLNREKLVRVSLACAYRVNQVKAGMQKFFKEPVFSSLFAVADVPRYAFGYEVLRLLEDEKTRGVKGDRHQEKKYGQALKHGEYAVVAVCVNLGIKFSKTPKETLAAVLGQWMAYEGWVAKQTQNAPYISGTALDGTSYYKGGTVNADLQSYKFVV